MSNDDVDLELELDLDYGFGLSIDEWLESPPKKANYNRPEIKTSKEKK